MFFSCWKYQLKQLADEQAKAEAAKKLKDDRQSADIKSFLAALAEVTDREVDEVFAEKAPALEE